MQTTKIKIHSDQSKLTKFAYLTNKDVWGHDTWVCPAGLTCEKLKFVKQIRINCYSAVAPLWAQKGPCEPTKGFVSKSDPSEMHFSILETRSRNSSFQSHALRRDREFIPFGIMLRDEIENLFPLVSCFETRSRSLVKIVFLNFCFHFCQNVTFQQDTVWGGWKWKWLLKVWSKLWFRLLRFPAKPFKPVFKDILKPSHTHLTIKI